MSTALRTYYRGYNLVGMRDEVASASRYYHFDPQGTAQCLTDSTGAVTDRFASDAWGVQAKRTGTSINRQWYVGNWGYYRQVDQALDYIRARYLEMYHGRWLSMDQLLREGNSYQYSANGPSRSFDPTGHLRVLGIPGPSYNPTYFGNDLSCCGGRQWYFKFQLEQPSTCPVPRFSRAPAGYFVQRVTRQGQTWNCLTHKANPKSYEVFYEAFPTDNNQKTDRAGLAQGNSDGNYFPGSRINQLIYGWQRADAEVKFFCGKTTGDLTNNPSWGKGSMLGWVYAYTPLPTGTGPSCWFGASDLNAGSDTRKTGSEWSCCCVDADFSRTYCSPAPAGNFPCPPPDVWWENCGQHMIPPWTT
jgi:RHS repeat-associated protein